MYFTSSPRRALDKLQYFVDAERPTADAQGVVYGLSTLLTMSQDKFVGKFPEYALWRVQRRKRSGPRG